MIRTTLALSLALVVAAASQAATITYTLDLTGAPGTFSLYGESSAGDNGGIVLYSVPLLGNVTSFDNMSPNAFTQLGASGFSDIRTADAAAGGVNPVIGGAQNLVTGQVGARLYGYGQTAGSFAAAGLNVAFKPDATAQEAWEAKALLATGTYTGDLDFARSSVDLVGNVWNQPQGGEAPAAEVALVRLTDTGVIPEPTTLGLLGLALAGCLGIRRR